MTREAVLAKVWANPVSRRYIIKAKAKFVPGIYDQRNRCFVPDDEIAGIDPDEKMSLR